MNWLKNDESNNLEDELIKQTEIYIFIKNIKWVQYITFKLIYTCQNICKHQENEREYTTLTKAKNNKGQESDRESKTDPFLSQQLLIRDDSIADENNCYISQKQPYFIKTKEISSVQTHTDRKNRFENDIEQEIRYKIQQIKLQEEEEIRKLEEQYLLEMKQKEEKGQKQQALDNQFSFQNSMKESQSELPNNQQTTNPYLPRQTSQFAPKKPDTDTVSQKSQISKTPTQKDQQISPKSEMMKKSALKKILIQRDELQSIVQIKICCKSI